jgi:hypothetical protein
MPTVLCNLETSGNGSKEYAIMQPLQQKKKVVLTAKYRMGAALSLAPVITFFLDCSSSHLCQSQHAKNLLETAKEKTAYRSLLYIYVNN